MKTMKVIDLLNKIANGEELPKKFKYEDMIFYLNQELNEHYSNEHSFNYYYDITDIDVLNDEVEIIEDTPKEEKKKYIEHIKMQENELHNHLNIIEKINEIIDRLNGDK